MYEKTVDLASLGVRSRSAFIKLARTDLTEDSNWDHALFIACDGTVAQFKPRVFDSWFRFRRQQPSRARWGHLSTSAGHAANGVGASSLLHK